MIEKGHYIDVLDKGFVGLIDYMGSDEAIVQAARVSYGAGTKKVSDDRALIRYLMKHRHSTPFEMCEVKFHIKLPMDCNRQLIRHRTASVNEYSTRYSEAISDNQETKPDEWRAQSTENKQGSGSGYIGDDTRNCLSNDESNFLDYAHEIYQSRLAAGVAREQARKDLPLSTYTELYWKMDLRNLLHFLSLRMDSHAQLEIRTYANAIASIVKELFPLAWEAFEDYNLYSIEFSRIEQKILVFAIANPSIECIMEECGKHGMSGRESREFVNKIEFLREQNEEKDNMGKMG